MASEQVFRGACTNQDSAVGWFHHHPAEGAMASNTQIPETRQEYLGAIPLLMSYFDRLHIKDIVDQAYGFG